MLWLLGIEWYLIVIFNYSILKNYNNEKNHYLLCFNAGSMYS